MAQKKSKKKIALISCTVFAVLALATVVIILSLPKNHTLSEQEYNRIEQGMTLDEVKTIYSNFDSECRLYSGTEYDADAYMAWMTFTSYICESGDRTFTFAFTGGKLFGKTGF